MRVLRIVFPTTVVRVDEPTVSMPSQRARRTVLPMIAASTPPLQMPPSFVPHLGAVAWFGVAPVAGRVADVGDDVVEREAVQRGGGAAVLLLREQDAVRAEASDSRSDDARVARPVRAEREDPFLGAPVAFDQRILDGDVRERAPDVHAVRAYVDQAQPAESARRGSRRTRRLRSLDPGPGPPPSTVRSEIEMLRPFATSRAKYEAPAGAAITVSGPEPTSRAPSPSFASCR